MPGREQSQAIGACDLLQGIHLAQVCARRLFQHDVLARFECSACQRISSLRRSTKGDGIDFRFGVQQRIDVAIIAYILHLRVLACTRDKPEAGTIGDGRQMLIARDLANAYDGKRKH
ncbi:hypothetical protein BURK_008926 [Burkholderia sp. SJ98]|nr:hypothetical protein BURK_008926 [Burkholderia sp. SJ98]